MASKVRPLGDRIVVKPIPKEEVTKSGIVLPDTAKEKPMQGRALAVGNGKLLDNGVRVPVDIKENDVVLFGKYSGTEFKLDNEDLLVLAEKDVLGVVEEA